MSRNLSAIELKLKALGKELPPLKTPSANYKPFTCVDGLLYISGQIGNQGITHRGPVGVAVTAEEAAKEAELAGLGVLSVLNTAVAGQADRVVQVLRLGVFIAASPGFGGHGLVANGASNLIVDVLGERGQHARTSVGVASLPSGAAVEVDAVVRVLASARDAE